MKDNILNVEYELEQWNAILLSKMLKETFRVKYNITDLKEFSKESSVDNISDTYPEIYEYQNFFILKRLDGSYLLLDGFRRLLLYSGLPDIDVNVRVYDESKMTQNQIINLMLMLNHTKFFGGIGKYYDKGFNLIFFLLFGFNINKFNSVFEGYVVYNETDTESYIFRTNIHETSKLSILKNKLTQPKSIEDLQKLYELFLLKPTINKFYFFGSLLYQFREKYPEMVFDVDKFMELTNNPEIIKLETDCPRPEYGARETKHVRKLMEFYSNALSSMVGEEVKETFVEASNRVKELKTKLKKDKSLVLFSKKIAHDSENFINNTIFKTKKPFKLKVLVFPHQEQYKTIVPGIYDDFIINQQSVSSHLMALRVSYIAKSKSNPDLVINFSRTYMNNLRIGGVNYHGNFEVYVDISETYNDSKVEIIDYRKK